jgi:hypothetical protein
MTINEPVQGVLALVFLYRIKLNRNNPDEYKIEMIGMARLMNRSFLRKQTTGKTISRIATIRKPSPDILRSVRITSLIDSSISSHDLPAASWWKGRYFFAKILLYAIVKQTRPIKTFIMTDRIFKVFSICTDLIINIRNYWICKHAGYKLAFSYRKTWTPEDPQIRPHFVTAVCHVI